MMQARGRRWFVSVVAFSLLGGVTAGCATASRMIVKTSSLREGDAYAVLDVERPSSLAQFCVQGVAVRTENGEMKQEALVDKDSIGLNAAKIAFALTPLGMLNWAASARTLSPLMHLPAGEVEVVVLLAARKELPRNSRSGGSPTFLVSTWCYKLHVALEAGKKYLLAWREEPVLLDEDGKLVAATDEAGMFPFKEADAQALLLEMASEDLIKAGAEVARERGLRSVPIYPDNDGNLLVVSGTLDLARSWMGNIVWDIKDEMVLNVGKKAISIYDISLDRGEYFYASAGEIRKEQLSGSRRAEPRSP